jgi:hypothetical protein
MDYQIVKIAGKNLPLYFGFNALRKFCRNTGTSLSKLQTLGNDMTLDDALQLIVVGVEEGVRKAGTGEFLTADELGDLLDEDMSGLEAALKIFGEQIGDNLGGGKKGTKKKASKKKK